MTHAWPGRLLLQLLRVNKLPIEVNYKSGPESGRPENKASIASSSLSTCALTLPMLKSASLQVQILIAQSHPSLSMASPTGIYRIILIINLAHPPPFFGLRQPLVCPSSREPAKMTGAAPPFSIYPHCHLPYESELPELAVASSAAGRLARPLPVLPPLPLPSTPWRPRPPPREAFVARIGASAFGRAAFCLPFFTKPPAFVACTWPFAALSTGAGRCAGLAPSVGLAASWLPAWSPSHASSMG